MYKKTLSFLMITFLLASCRSTPHFFYQDYYRSNININQKNCFEDTKLVGCPSETFYLSKDGSKTIAILEIDEQGKFINQKQANAILEYVQSKVDDSSKPKPIIFNYIHGWNHNSIEDDTNWQIPNSPKDLTSSDDKFYSGDLRKFGRAIHNLHASQKEIIAARANKSSPETLYKNHDIIGIYISWRAKVFPKPINYITFYDRKAVSEEIGRNDLQRFLLQLEILAKPNKIDQSQNSILVSIGHSFGGSALYNSISSILLSRFYQSLNDRKVALSVGDPNSTKIPLRGYGDLVVIINPAIEATRFISLREAVWRERLKDPNLFADNPRPLFVSLGGSGDIATRKAFKFGRSFHTTFTENYRTSTLINGNGQASTGPEFEENEWNLDTTSIGNYSPFYTHWVIKTRDYITSHSRKNTDMENLTSPISLSISPDACEFDTGKNLVLTNKMENPDLITPLKISNHFISRYDNANSYKDWPKGEPTKTTIANSPTWKNNPYWFVRASTDVISSHTDIWNRQVGCFILEVLLRNNVTS